MHLLIYISLACVYACQHDLKSREIKKSSRNDRLLSTLRGYEDTSFDLFGAHTDRQTGREKERKGGRERERGEKEREREREKAARSPCKIASKENCGIASSSSKALLPR